MSMIPLRRRNGQIIAHAVVDDLDLDLAAVRWHLNSLGYVVRAEWYDERKRCRTVYLHREVLARMGHADAPEGDHKDRDKLNCRRSNLRPADRSLNNRNKAVRSSTGFRGVTPLPSGRFRAVSRRKHIGVYDTTFEAAHAVAQHESMHPGIDYAQKAAA